MTSEEAKATAFTATKSTKMAKTQDKIATGILTAIVVLILIALVAIIAYIVVSGACKLFDIHFLTAKPEQFKAGGGITSKSDCRREYEEVIQKIYLPF